MTAPSEAYPFSTQDGKAIPLDIIKPAYLLIKNFSIVSSSLTITEDMRVATLFSSVSCLFRFEVDIPVIVDGTAYSRMILVPANTILTVALVTGTAYVKSLSGDNGTLYLQVIEKWAGLALDRQYSRK